MKRLHTSYDEAHDRLSDCSRYDDSGDIRVRVIQGQQGFSVILEPFEAAEIARAILDELGE